MKKSLIVCAGLCAALVLSSCGSSKETAYRKAYEKALAMEKQNQQPAEESATVVEDVAEVTQIVAPVVEQSANQASSVVVDNYDNVKAVSENVTVVNGTGLKAFSVVVGSYQVKANAESQQARLKSAGYPAQVVYNSSNQKYRVIATTHDSKGDAARSRDALASQYNGAWLLYSK